MNSKSMIAKDIIKKINSLSLNNDPFEHLLFENFFKKAVYNEIIKECENDRLFNDYIHKDSLLENGKSTRKTWIIEKLKCGNFSNGVTATLRHIYEAFNSKEVKLILLEKFLYPLRNRFPEKDDIKFIPIYMHMAILKDLNGYFITPHKDTKKKIITLHIYLAEDYSQLNLGTSFYKLIHKEDKKSLSIDFTMLFKPNSGFCFAVTDSSWHGIPDPLVSNKPRYSLSVVYYLNPDFRKLGYGYYK